MRLDPPLERLDGCGVIERIVSGAADGEDVARACLSRIAEREPVVRCWAWLDPAAAVAQARELDKRSDRGPLHGVPIAVKDVIHTRGMPTRHNSPIYQDSPPGLDAACVAILRAAGAVILGKTETVEFAATGRRTRTRNPFDVSRTPGGTSSGSAAAVADFQVPIALATQTAGSTIRPASFCGVHAFKPSWGNVSREGVKLFAQSLDTVAWMARSVRDLELLADVFAIAEDGDPWTGSDLRGARIMLCRTPAWRLAEEPTRRAMDVAAATLHAAGAAVEMRELPSDFDALLDAHATVMNGEARVAFLHEYRCHPHLLHPDIASRVRNTGGISPTHLRRALDLAASCRIQFDELAADYDAVLTPSAVGVAPIGLQNTGDASFNRMWTLLHTPCVNLPAYRDSSGLPVGVTLTGPRDGDRKLLRVAALCAAALDASQTSR